MRRHKSKILFYSLAFIYFISCTKKRETSFYYWKTTYFLDSTEQFYLKKLDVKKIYVRFFDIAIENSTPKPIAQIQILEKNDLQEIIPVVFITNETFKTLSKINIEQLAKNCILQIEYLYPKISDKKLKEIQFDCDWTASTKENYFYFLKQVQQQFSSYQFSCTIRLHQIKDRKTTGIPPIKTGVLMYYATSNPLDFQDENSILNNHLAENYCSTLTDYAIHLDFALPIYSWTIIQNQVGEKRLLNGIRKEMLRDTSIYKPLQPNFYLVKKDHYLEGNYLYEDFVLKVEEVSQKQIQDAKIFLKNNLKNNNPNIIFFQLDSANLMHYNFNDLSY